MLRTLTAACLIASAANAEPGVLNPDTDSPGLKVGQPAPDATVSTLDGQTVSLADLYADGPVVITFYRGSWCPYCTRALAGWQEMASQFTDAGANLVYITPEKPDRASAVAAKTPALTHYIDADQSAAKAFRLAFEVAQDTQKIYKDRYNIDLAQFNADSSWVLPSPATFVIGTDGVVRWAFADWDYSKRADPADALAAVKAAD